MKNEHRLRPDEALERAQSKKGCFGCIHSKRFADGKWKCTEGVKVGYPFRTIDDCSKYVRKQ